MTTPLTNAHTHLELGWLADCCPDENGQDFLPWLTTLTERWRGMAGCYAEIVYRKAVEEGIQTLLDSGTTHITDISATGHSIAPLLKSDLKGIIYIELLTPFPTEIEKRFNLARYLVDEWRPKERADMRIGLTLHTPYTVHPSLWRKALQYTAQENLPLAIHVAESPAEYEWHTKGTGPLADHMDMLGNPFSSPRKTPIQYLSDLGALDQQPLLIHAVEVTEEDVQIIKASGSRVVHCPRSNQRLKCGRMPLELFLKHVVSVYLGTDGLSSSPSLNIHEEIEAAVALHDGYVTRQQIEQLAAQPLVM